MPAAARSRRCARPADSWPPWPTTLSGLKAKYFPRSAGGTVVSVALHRRCSRTKRRYQAAAPSSDVKQRQPDGERAAATLGGHASQVQCQKNAENGHIWLPRRAQSGGPGHLQSITLEYSDLDYTTTGRANCRSLQHSGRE